MKKAIIITFITIISLCSNLFSQSNRVKDNENHIVEIINTILKQKNTKVYLYSHFIDFKGIHAFLSNPKLLDELYGHCMKKSRKITFENYISNNRNDFIKEIEKRKENVPLSKLKKKLLKDIKLVEDYSSVKHQNLIKVSAPFIIEDICILYLQTKNEELILVLERDGKIWKTVCVKYLFFTIDN